jgi:hypothetical protein
MKQEFVSSLITKLMAGIDKIYLNRKQYSEFKKYLKSLPPMEFTTSSFWDSCKQYSIRGKKHSEEVRHLVIDSPISFLYKWKKEDWKNDTELHPVCNLSYNPEFELFLLAKCPLSYIRDRIKEQYGFLYP